MLKIKIITKKEIKELTRTTRVGKGIPASFRHTVEVGGKLYEGDEEGRIFVLSKNDDQENLGGSYQSKQDFIDFVYDDLNL